MNASHEDAFNHVQSRRFCASPNTNFKRQIEAYESINAAMVAIAQHSTDGQQDTSMLRRKRDEDDHATDEMGDVLNSRKRRDMVDSDDEEMGEM